MWLKEVEFRDPVSVFEHYANITGSIFLDSATSSFSLPKVKEENSSSPLPELREENSPSPLPQAGEAPGVRVSQHAQYSFIGIDPFLKIQAKNNEIYVNQKKYFGNPFQILRKYLSRYPLEIETKLCPFQGGVMGYFGYGLSQHLEVLTKPAIDDLEFPDLCVGFYDVVIGFDLSQKKSWIFSSGYPEEDLSCRKQRAIKRIDFVEKSMDDVSLKTQDPHPQPLSYKLERGAGADRHPLSHKSNLTSNFTRQTYESAVKKAIQYIKAGDIFQVNLSQRFTAALESKDHPFALYKRLREINPAPFAAYLNFSPTVIASASPERFLRLFQKQVETKPIKGTCPRGDTPQKDYEMSQQLLNSEKDRSENIMIVDLMRNDLSKVCENFSIKVSKLCQLESFSTVHHLVSTVQGKLRDNCDAIDLLMATFPGGSVTGAPKIRAMEIITEIEKLNRGPYCGSIGYIGFNGDMDSSIIIRTFAIQDQQVTFQVGGAIVFDSDPSAEYQETLDKAKALMQALENL